MYGAIVGVGGTARCDGFGEVRDGSDCNVRTGVSYTWRADRRAADSTAVGDVCGVTHCGEVLADAFVVRMCVGEVRFCFLLVEGCV